MSATGWKKQVRWGAALAALALGAVVAGCGHMPLRSMVKLAKVDFSTTALADMGAGVTLPFYLKPRPNRTRLEVKVEVGSERMQEDVVLSEETDPVRIAELNGVAKGQPGITYAYRLSRESIAELEAIRTRALAFKASHKAANGSLTIAIKPDVCRVGPIPAGAVLFTTYLRTSETGGFVTFLRDVDMRGVVDGVDVVEKIEPCAE